MGGEDPLALHPQVHEQQRVLLLVRQTGGGGPAAVQELEVAVELGHPSPEVDGGVSGMLEVGCRGGNWDGPVVCHGCSPALSSSGGEWKVSPAWAKAGQSSLKGGGESVRLQSRRLLPSGLGWGQVFFFFCTGVANCGVFFRMRERGVSRLDIHIEASPIIAVLVGEKKREATLLWKRTDCTQNEGEGSE